MNRLKRLCAIAAGALAGFALAFFLAKLVKPFWPVPHSGVGFVTVHGIPKGIDEFRFLLVLLLVVAGMLVAHRLSGGGGEPAPRAIDAGAFVREPCSKWLVWSSALLLAGLRIAASPGIHGSIDLFHEGHHLAPASRVLSGGAFYRDVFPYHGLLADGGVDTLAFRAFGASLAVSRRLHIALDAFFFAAAAVAFGSVAADGASYLTAMLLLIGLTDALGLPGNFPFYRTLPLLLSAVATVRFIQTGRRRNLVLAGAAASLGLVWSLEIGLFSLFSLAVWPFAERLIGGSSSASRGRLAPLAGGAVLGAMPLCVVLLRRGALGPFLHDSYFAVRSADSIWGFPAPGVRELVAGALHPFGAPGWEAIRFHAPALFFGVILGRLLIARRSGNGDRESRAIFALLVFSIVAFRSALGRVSYSHTRYSMVVASLLIAFALGPWLRYARRRRRSRWLAAMLLAGTFLLYSDLGRSLFTAARRFSNAPSRFRGDGLVALGLERSGGVRVPAAQAASLESLDRFVRQTVAPGETFFDFANSPALYFLLRRDNPVRILESADLSADDFEKEAIGILQARRPALVVVSSPPELENFDRVANATRCPRLWAWIAKNYPAESTVGGFGIRTP